MEKLTSNYRIKAFGVTREIFGAREITVSCAGQTVAALKEALYANYPPLSDLRSIFIAVNNTYADDQHLIHETDEIAIIPPVSGG
jgi:sulfur-carrier protein